MLRLSLINQSGQVTLTSVLLQSLQQQLRANPDVHCIVIEGDADAFCEGLDLNTFTAISDDKERKSAFVEFKVLLDTLAASPAIVIAAVRGKVLGGGLGFLGVADCVIAEPDVTFSLPETMLGIIPAVILPHITRRMGIARAQLLALGYQALSAEQALAYGLIDEVSTSLCKRLNKQIQRFLRMDAKAVATMKQLINVHAATPLWHEHYFQDAIDKAIELASSPQVKKRVELLQQGFAPWSSEVVVES